MGEGWIKLHRRFLDWEWFTTPNMVRLFTFLLVAANHEDGRWQGVEVKRGQLVTGRQSLSAKTGISERSIRTCLARLEQTGEITQKSTNKFSIITVCKYSDYQTADVANRPATDQQPTSNKKKKNVRMKEKILSCKSHDRKSQSLFLRLFLSLMKKLAPITSQQQKRQGAISRRDGQKGTGN